MHVPPETITLMQYYISAYETAAYRLRQIMPTFCLARGPLFSKGLLVFIRLGGVADGLGYRAA